VDIGEGSQENFGGSVEGGANMADGDNISKDIDELEMIS
jgi:hypothetical protein